MEEDEVLSVHYEIAVIGAGMIGSSAAKHVALSNQQTGTLTGPSDVKTKLVLIGPNRPQDQIYGAWFDEARITRKLDRNANWKLLGNNIGFFTRKLLFKKNRYITITYVDSK